MGNWARLSLFQCMVAFARSAWPMRLKRTMKSSGIVNQLEWIIWTRHVGVAQLNGSSRMIRRQIMHEKSLLQTFPAQNLIMWDNSTFLSKMIIILNAPRAPLWKTSWAYWTKPSSLRLCIMRILHQCSIQYFYLWKLYLYDRMLGPVGRPASLEGSADPAPPPTPTQVHTARTLTHHPQAG